VYSDWRSWYDGVWQLRKIRKKPQLNPSRLILTEPPLDRVPATVRIIHCSCAHGMICHLLCNRGFTKRLRVVRLENCHTPTNARIQKPEILSSEDEQPKFQCKLLTTLSSIRLRRLCPNAELYHRLQHSALGGLQRRYLQRTLGR